jgi:hypothetical protein
MIFAGIVSVTPTVALNDVFADYLERAEWKSFPANGVGPLERRRLIIAHP